MTAMKERLKDFVTIFALTFVVAAVVSSLYNMLVHGSCTIDWGLPVVLGIIMGIVLPWTQSRESGKKK